MDVDFYFSVGSRYSYLASTQLPRISAATGARFLWHPVNNPELLRRRGDPFAGTNRSRQFDADYRATDVRRWAELYRVPYREPEGRLPLESQLLALTATAGDMAGRAEDVGRALFERVFLEERTSFGREDAIEILAGVGLDAPAAAARLDDPKTGDLLSERIDAAIRRGVHGVPTFFVDDEHYFGNDRLPLLEHRLRRA